MPEYLYKLNENLLNSSIQRQICFVKICTKFINLFRLFNQQPVIYVTS